MLHTVIQVVPTHDFKVVVYFDDGKIKLYDMSPFLNKGVFAKISDIKIFMEICTVMNHTLAWDISRKFDPTQCIDIDPETIYINGVDIVDPLFQVVA